MNRKNLTLIFGILFTLSLVGCTQKAEETKNVPYPPPEQQEEFVSVPNAGEAWEAVKIQVVEIEGGASTDYEIKIGADYMQINNSDLKIKVAEFIPDFFMGGQNRIGSRSKELNNPAARIVVVDPGKPEPYEGWIFSRYPDIHKGASDKFSFRLVDFVKKKS